MTRGSREDLSSMSMMDLFRMEAETHCATLTEDLLGLEQDPTASDRLESLMRAAHSVKGAARIVGLNPAVLVAHAMEDVFVAAQNDSLSLTNVDVDTLLKGVDMLTSIAHLPDEETETWLANQEVEIAGLVQSLTAISKQEKPKEKLPSVKTEPVAKTASPVSSARPAPKNQATGDLSSMSMMDLFRMEAENHCATLTEDLLGLEQDPTASDRLESLMRAAHSVKGAARIVGFNPGVQVAHAMEDVFVAAQHNDITLTRDSVDLLLQGVDMLARFASLADNEVEPWLTGQNQVVDDLVQALVVIAQKKALQEKQQPAADQGTQQTPSIPTPQSISSPPEQPTTVSLAGLSMMGLFRAEASRHCATLLHDLEALVSHPEAKERLDSSVRAAHAIKGAALIVGLASAGQTAQAIEEYIIRSRQSHTPMSHAGIALVRKAVDVLNLVAGLADKEVVQWFSDHELEVNALSKELSGDLKSETALSQVVVTAPQPLPEKIPVQAVPPVTAKVGPCSEQTSPPSVPPATRGDKKIADSKTADRTLRVSAEGMNRLMGLAGDVLVESRWLPTFGLGILRLKRRQDELVTILDRIREELALTKNLSSKRLIELRQKIQTCRELTIESLTDLEDHARRSTETSHRLYREVLANRMRPFADGIQGFPRMVRDVARELGKEVRLEIIGQETLVDRDILEKIESPLNHLLRNAVDHGIEMPDLREKAGKKREAIIRLEAAHRSGMLNITIADDGKGVDLEGLRKTIVAKKLVAEEIAAVLSEPELMDFLFLPNFSTRQSVSKISGRGVGLDVVHSVVHEVRGVVRAQTKLGLGTRFDLQLPLTLSVMRALLTEICDEPYAFPLVAVDHVLKVPNDSIKELEGRQYFILNDKRIGVVSARQILEKDQPQKISDEQPIIVLSDRLNQYGLIVDRFIGIRDLVVQVLDPRLGKLKDISSAALLEDGAPVLIVDVEDLVRSMDGLISGNRLKRIDQQDGEQEKIVKRILVADDSITVREVERKMLLAKGYEVDVAVDGMDAWNTVRTGNYNMVITDVDMPRMNGIELVSLIRQDPNLNRMPVIIVSYKDREEDRTRGLDAGADYYLTKGSFQNETLVEAVKDLIGEPEAD